MTAKLTKNQVFVKGCKVMWQTGFITSGCPTLEYLIVSSFQNIGQFVVILNIISFLILPGP